MITRAYYKNDPITASINIKHVVNSTPTSYILYISHKLNGIICNKEVSTVDEAFTNASIHGCNKNLWEIYPSKEK